MRTLSRFGMSGRDERLLQELLQIRLAHIDHVIDVRGAPKVRVIVVAARRTGGPQRAVRPRRELPILEVTAEQAQLPELIRDVLADVGHDSVRANDYFFPLLLRFLRL